MNVRPNELAIIVNCSKGLEDCLGHICTIVTATTHPMTGESGWIFDPPVRVGQELHDSTLDRHLRPIRDPGDDAIDWISRRMPRSADLQQDQLTRARAQLLEVASS